MLQALHQLQQEQAAHPAPKVMRVPTRLPAAAALPAVAAAAQSQEVAEEVGLPLLRQHQTWQQQTPQVLAAAAS